MLRLLFITIIAVSSLIPELKPCYAQDASKKEIIGYLPNWAVYRRNRLFNPSTIKYEKFTVLDYSFFYPDSTGRLKSCDAFADKLLLKGTDNVVDGAHAKGVKVMVSLGGWSLSTNFSAIANDPEKREFMAAECVRLLEKYQFDGIDIDWEWPTSPHLGGHQYDKHNFTLLLQDIRKVIDEYGEKVGSPMMLTAALGGAPNHMEAIEWGEVVKVLDYVNLMTYATNGIWSQRAGHSSPLYQNPTTDPGCTSASVEHLHNEYGVPMNKILVGLPFYGTTVLFPEGEAALGSDKHLHKSDTAGYFHITEGSPSYYDILEHAEHFDEYWDDEAKCPYMISKDKTVFVTYDNEKSIEYKANYVNEIGAGGVIIWDVSHDYIERAPNSGVVKATPLADVVMKTLGHNPKSLKKIKKRKRLKG